MSVPSETEARSFCVVPALVLLPDRAAFMAAAQREQRLSLGDRWMFREEGRNGFFVHCLGLVEKHYPPVTVRAADAQWRDLFGWCGCPLCAVAASLDSGHVGVIASRRRLAFLMVSSLWAGRIRSRPLLECVDRHGELWSVYWSDGWLGVPDRLGLYPACYRGAVPRVARDD